MFRRNSKQDTESGSMRPFFTIWTGQAFSLLGSALVQFALVWWLTKATGSATVLAAATMMATLPQVLISPMAGALVDRWNRRVVMVVADSVIALAVAVLVVLYAFDSVQIWHIYVVMFVRATGGAFHWPAMQASTSLMVPEKHLSRVAGLNQVLQGLAAIAAPPLGALLLDTLPMQAVLAIDIVTAGLAIVPLFFVHVPQPARTVAAEGVSRGSVIADLREGLRFLRGWPGMLMVIGIAMAVNLLLHPAMSLQPLLVTEHFGAGALELAWLQSAFGIGFVAGGITLSAWGGFKRRAVTGALALALSGLGFALVGLTPAGAFWLAVGAMFLAGFMTVIVNGSIFAMLQAVVPPEVQGRVFTVVLSGSGMMAPLGLAIAGPVADALGVRAWFVAGGAVMVMMGVGALCVPAIMRIEDKTLLKGEAVETPATADAILAASPDEAADQRSSALSAAAQ
jgi:DHA3 family macrolide efflux protein-like MFS transporter